MLIEIKTSELSNLETIQLIKRQIFLANRVEKKIPLDLLKELCKRLKELSNIAEKLSDIEESISVIFDENDLSTISAIPIVIGQRNLIIIVWNEIIHYVVKIISLAGNIAVDEEDLKNDLCWKDIKILAKSFSDSLSFM